MYRLQLRAEKFCSLLLLIAIFRAAYFVRGAERVAPPLTEYRDYAMSHEGSSERGKRIFAEARAGCATCHTLEGTPLKLGPD